MHPPSPSRKTAQGKSKRFLHKRRYLLGKENDEDDESGETASSPTRDEQYVAHLNLWAHVIYQAVIDLRAVRLLLTTGEYTDRHLFGYQRAVPPPLKYIKKLEADLLGFFLGGMFRSLCDFLSLERSCVLKELKIDKER